MFGELASPAHHRDHLADDIGQIFYIFGRPFQLNLVPACGDSGVGERIFKLRQIFIVEPKNYKGIRVFNLYCFVRVFFFCFDKLCTLLC